MPKSKSHKGLLKRIKITKSGKVRFRRPHSRHLKSNKTGEQVRGYRKARFARAGDMGRLGGTAWTDLPFLPFHREIGR